MNIDLILFIAAAICFGAAFLGVAAGRFNLTALGLLLWILTNLI